MSKEKKPIEITELVLQMGDTKVSMSLEDAEKVFQVLEKIFGRKIEKEYVPYYPHRWYYYPDYQKPYITWGNKSIGTVNSNDFNDSPKWELSNGNFSVDAKTLCLNVDSVRANIIS